MDFQPVLMFSFMGPEMLIVLGLAVLLFGAKKIPELMKGMGQGIKEFKKGMNELDEVDKSKEETTAKETEEAIKK